MEDMKMMEIELGELVSNEYNPRTRMTKKYLETLKASLKEDGQLQTVLVRPVDDGKYEVVAGMRRYLCFKELYDDDFKVACIIQDLDDKTAKIRSWKENYDRENTSPIDDAGWFFGMLNLKEEQLFTPHEQTTPAIGENPLPSRDNLDAINLAKELHIDPRIIERRLPLLALPLDLQDIQNKTFLGELKENEISMNIVKAESVSRLRLIGDKDNAYKEMRNVWKKWGAEDRDFINEQITKILETYKEEAEVLLKELGTTEKNLDGRIDELNIWVDKDIGDWLNPKSKKSIYSELPEELLDSKKGGLELPEFRERGKDENERDFANKIYNSLENFVMDITKNDTLDNIKDDLDIKKDKFETGMHELDDGLCVYCGSSTEKKAIEKRISILGKAIDDLHDKIEKKDDIRGNGEKLKRELGNLIRKYDTIVGKYVTTLDKLKESEKLSEKDYNEKIEKYKLKGIKEE